jgi:hypothetical protein
MSAAVLAPATDRLAMRRVVFLRCEVVSLAAYRMVGTEALDVSRTGLLVAAEGVAERHEPVLVHLFTGEGDIVAAAEVARVARGLRRSDHGTALGLRFTRVSSAHLDRLLTRLRGTPPPVPRRRIRPDYARTVRAIHLTSA